MCNVVGQYIQMKGEEKRIEEEQAAKAQNWKLPVCYDDDDDEERSISLKDNIISGLPPCAAITTISSTEEPDNSLSMGDEHLDTIPATESNKFIKYSVENLVPIPCESEGFLRSNDGSTSNDDDSFSIDNIEYVEASPSNSELVSSEVMEIVIPEVGGIDDDILLKIKDDILREKLLNVNLLIANIEELNDNPTPSFDLMTNSGSTTTRSDISLPEYEAFYDDHVKEISSGSTTTHSECSFYDSFIFDLSINPFPPADRSDFYEFVAELTHIISPPNESLFAYVVWIFLPFLSYSVAPQYLLSFGNEDTIFDPGTCSYHISSFMPDVSHRSGTFIKFKVLNESPMEISFSTCSPMDQ
uniref:Uncharacterized protein n=1 Tax=Tanacetum cinerariifolium TaxID=118510 RepID=A0A6L2K4B6_TANCI|nr:hypothetical protein [Tanacetum cinerariifolium]